VFIEALVSTLEEVDFRVEEMRIVVDVEVTVFATQKPQTDNMKT